MENIRCLLLLLVSPQYLLLEYSADNKVDILEGRNSVDDIPDLLARGEDD